MRHRWWVSVIVFSALAGVTTAFLSGPPKLAEERVFPGSAMAEMVQPIAEQHTERASDKNTLILSFVGDCTLGKDPSNHLAGNFDQYYEKNSADYFFRNVAAVFQHSDMTVANLEGVLADADKARDKQYQFLGLPKYAGILSRGGINAVNLANKHTRDFDDFGLAQTLGALSATGIDYFGERFVLKRTLKGIPLAFLGYAQWHCSPAAMEKQIRELTRQGYTVIVSFHWGEESDYTPEPRQRELAHQAIDAGAFLVVGHHPHVLQPVEYYHGKPIAYSLGNFCFGGNQNPRDKHTMILQVKLLLERQRIASFKTFVIPCSISSTERGNNYQPTMVRGSNAQAILRLIKS